MPRSGTLRRRRTWRWSAPPRPTVPDVVQACGEAGVGAVVVISAGFRETGAGGRGAGGGGRAAGGGIRRPARARPELPRADRAEARAQRQLRRLDARRRSRGLRDPVGRAGHVADRLGAGRADRVLPRRLSRKHDGRGPGRPDRLPRPEPGHALDHPVHRERHEPAQVHVRRARVRPRQADRGLQGRALRPPRRRPRSRTPERWPGRTASTTPPSSGPGSSGWTASRTCSPRPSCWRASGAPRGRGWRS